MMRLGECDYGIGRLPDSIHFLRRGGGLDFGKLGCKWRRTIGFALTIISGRPASESIGLLRVRVRRHRNRHLARRRPQGLLPKLVRPALPVFGRQTSLRSSGSVSLTLPCKSGTVGIGREFAGRPIPSCPLYFKSIFGSDPIHRFPRNDLRIPRSSGHILGVPPLLVTL